MEDLSGPGGARVRSLRQWNLNGLDEFVVGLFFCALGGIYLPVFPLTGSAIGRTYTMIAPYLQIVCCLAMVVTRKKLLAKLIFLRTGYVEFRPAKSRKWVMFAFMFVSLGIVVAIFAAFSGRLQLPDMSLAAGPALALVMAASFVLSGITYKLPHLIWLAGLSAVLGAVTYVIGAKTEGMLWVMVGIGAAMALSGAVRLRGFLQTHPIIEDHHG